MKLAMNRTATSLLYCSPDITYFDYGRTKQNCVPDVTTEEELDQVDEVDPYPRSQKRSPSLENHFPQSTNGDGSLPSSTDSSPDCDKIPSFPNPRLTGETQELIGTFLRRYIGVSQAGCTNKALPVMERVVKDVLDKHCIAYRGMLNRLFLDQKGDDMSFVSIVAKDIFSDGVTNWGRIASLIAFGATVCGRLKESGREHCVEAVSDQICSYLMKDQEGWLRRNNGWEGFVEFFRVEDPESVVRSALMAFAGVAGIGAGLALLMR